MQRLMIRTGLNDIRKICGRWFYIQRTFVMGYFLKMDKKFNTLVVMQKVEFV